MANNLAVGPNAVVAKQAISFASAGVTSVNTQIIYKVGNPSQSYVPGRTLNAITAFEVDNGYYMIMKQAVDFSAFLVPPVGGSVVVGTLPYVQEVTADAPIYYNRMDGTTATLTPVIGTGNITLANGALPNQAGLVAGGKSVQFDGVDDYASVVLNLSTYTDIAIEFIANVAADGIDAATGFAFGGQNWDTVVGGFYASLQTASGAGYLGVKGNGTEEGATANAGAGKSQKSYPFTTKAADHHFVFHLTNKGFQSVMIDGVSVALTNLSETGEGADNTNNFANNALYLLGPVNNNFAKCKFSEFAIYAGTIPSTSRFQTHNAARNI